MIWSLYLATPGQAIPSAFGCFRLAETNCCASYRRRTERGKVVWRCATRIEKGKDACPHSPTLDEGWVQDTLSKIICEGSTYNEDIIRNEVDKIQVFDVFILILRTDGSQEKILPK